MLGSKSKSKQPAEKSNGFSMSNDSGTCVISKGTQIEGKFKATENVRMDGSVKGDFICDQRLVMGESGSIDGTTLANDAVIMGRIEGELMVKNVLHLKSSAVVIGNITAKSMIVEEGAKYNGECRVGAAAANPNSQKAKEALAV